MSDPRRSAKDQRAARRADAGGAEVEDIEEDEVGAAGTEDRGRMPSISAYTTSRSVRVTHSPSSAWIARVVPAASFGP